MADDWSRAIPERETTPCQSDRKDLAKETVKEIAQAFQRAATEEDVATCTALILEEASPLWPLLARRTSDLSDVQAEIMQVVLEEARESYAEVIRTSHAS